MKYKLAEITLPALLMLGLTVIMILGGFAAYGNIVEHDNTVNRIDTIKILTDDVVEKSFQGRLTEDYWKISKFTIRANELYLFFSAGNEPIYLSHKFTGDGTKKIESDLNVLQEHYLKFERPSVPECDGSACICYCSMSSPPWTPSDNSIGLEPAWIYLINDKTTKGFTCSNPSCIQVGNSDTDTVFFGNSRGRDSGYLSMVTKQVKASNDDDRFQPISMDISLVIQNEISDDGNIIFSTSAGDDYNYAEQDDDYVKILVNDYKWENGVVIGGTAYSKSKSDRKDNIIQGPPISIRIEASQGSNGTIGVCLHEQCLYSEGKKYLKTKKESLSKEQEFIQTSRKRFSKFEDYLSGEFLDNLNKLEKKEVEYADVISGFKTELKSVLEDIKTTGSSQERYLLLQKGKTTDTILFSLMAYGSEIYSGKELPLEMPFISTAKQFTDTIIIKSFDGETLTLKNGTKTPVKLIHLKDGSYTFYFGTS